MNAMTLFVRRRWLLPGIVAAVVVAAALAWWGFIRVPVAAGTRDGPPPVPVLTALAEIRDMPVRLKANGTAVALQSVDIRAQITSTVRTVHIREGQSVRDGDLLFTLDARAEEANLRKAEAQVEKDRADLASAVRNLERQRELVAQKFVSQSALDAAQNQVDTLTGQLAVDRAAVDVTRVAIGNTQIRASFPGRTGVIGVRPGSLVQPGGSVLVTVTQVDPITVAFTLPEKELGGLQRTLAAGPVAVEARTEGMSEAIRGKLVFVDNSVDSATATIRLKAEFANADARLWPGMFVNVTLSPRTVTGAAVIPAQAVQTGPDNQFVYVVGEDRKVAARPVTLVHVDAGLAAVNGIDAGARVVIEGAQNLRAGRAVTEAGADAAGRDSGKGGGKGGGKRKAAEAKP